MVRTIVVVVLLMGGGFLMASTFVGYPRAGKTYITKHREKRKSLRTGSGYYGYGPRYYGSRSFRGGGK